MENIIGNENGGHLNKTASCVSEDNRVLRLFINGKAQDGLAYITYLTENNRYGDFAKAGYRLFSFPVFFGYNHLNENSGLYVFTKGIFDGDIPDFSVFDADVAKILKACPDAFLLPRVNVSPSENWEKAHPDELCNSTSGKKSGRFSFASDIWTEEVKKELALFIEHVENSEYASHIAGYQIAGGNTEEWLALVPDGISGKRAEEKYSEYLRSHSCGENKTSFYRFYSELVAGRICEFASEVKRLTENRLAVGSFYGYTFECPDRTSGHHALRRLLECEDIDFVCSPISYSMGRQVGRDHPYMIPLGSVKLHGKLYFSENDTRTHLSLPVNNTPHYTSPIWFGPDEATSCEVIKMHAARALINGHSAWWFDMWGGWFADERYMKLLEKLRQIFEQSRSLPMGGVSNVAVFVDEEAYANLDDISVSGKVCGFIREALGKMGAPYDLYLASDAERVIGGYSAVIALVPARTPYIEKLSDMTRSLKIAYLEITDKNSGISTGELREFLKKGNVHLWCRNDAVIYANESYLFLHTAENAVYELETPEKENLLDVITGELFVSGRKIERGKSFLLRRLKNSK